MREVTVQIATQFGPIDCTGWTVADGLAVAYWPMRADPYTLTHIGSGTRVLGAEFGDRRLAIRCGRELAGAFGDFHLSLWLIQTILGPELSGPSQELEAIVARYRTLDQMVKDRGAGELWW